MLSSKPVAASSGLLLTGASGFVGRALHARLHSAGQRLRALSHHSTPLPAAAPLPSCQPGPALAAETDWRPLLADCSTVVHCAARVHLMQEHSPDPLAAYRAVNTAGTLALARQAAAAGVKRFIFLSTIKVHGESTAPGAAFSATSALAPQDAYARSKAEAEQGLVDLAAHSALEVVIIRPPLVYGPGVKANFARLITAVERGWPLPLGALDDNRRSLLALDNLVDLICTCIEHPAAANRAFVVCDGEDLSTAALLRRLAAAAGRRPRLLSVPLPLLQLVARLSGQRAALERLSGNLQVDMRATCAALAWQPPLSVAAGLQQCFSARPA